MKHTDQQEELAREAREILKMLSDRMKLHEKKTLLKALGVESIDELFQSDLSKRIEILRLEKRRRMRVTDCTFIIDDDKKTPRHQERRDVKESNFRAHQTFVDRSIPEGDK